MEKPTGVIQKIIESLQQVNALDTYSPIEKDIILHNLRAAYMIFLNIKTDEQNEESRVEKLFEVSGERFEVSGEGCEVSCENGETEIEIEEEPVEVEPVEEEIVDDIVEVSIEELESEEIEDEEIEIEEDIAEIEEVETEIEEDVSEIEEVVTEIEEKVTETEEVETEIEEEEIEPLFSKAPLVEQNVVLQDDLFELIPDAKPVSHSLFDEADEPKPEKKSLNDLLEKKDDNSLGAKFQQSHIPDLTKAIAINEKFSFIKELFQNSGVDFSNAIQKLNECENIDTAFVMMEELKRQYLWDTTSSAYLSLCDLVRRRFM